jgi:hypothetical protein
LEETGFNIIGIITMFKLSEDIGIERLNKYSEIIKIGKTFNATDLTMNHSVLINHMNTVDEEHQPVSVPLLFKPYINRYLKATFPSLEYFDSSQGHVIFITPKHTYMPSDTTYKLHICIEIEFWKQGFEKLLYYLDKNKPPEIQLFKFPLLTLKQVIDKTDPKYKKYYDFDGGSASANFIIYFATMPDQKEKVKSFLERFIVYWKTDGFDETAYRKVNNLSFNERLTKSLYITYDDDTATKMDFVDINPSVLVTTPIDSLNPIRNKKFTISKSLMDEIMFGCSDSLPDHKKDSFNKCLNEKYSLNIDELCAPVITKAHAWRYPERSGSENSIESLEYPRCNTTV